MTLIIALQGRTSIFQISDRRLSSGGKPVADNAVKVLSIDSLDGSALVGYAGVGRTGRLTEISTWMRSNLRGPARGIEDSLQHIIGGLLDQLPPILSGLGIAEPSQVLLASAIVDREVRAYMMSVGFVDGKADAAFERHRQRGRVLPVMVTGSGLTTLMKNQDWIRPLIRIQRQFERGRCSPLAVADQLAAINYGVHLRDASVGPRSIVVWRLLEGGGSHQHYDRFLREPDDWGKQKSLPYVAGGIDVSQLIERTSPGVLSLQESGQVHEMAPDELDAALRSISDKAIREGDWTPKRHLR